jgi:DNA-binding CsgD family transcriptional regulator
MPYFMDDLTRFATLLTRNPPPEELMYTWMRDFLSEQIVTAIEIQIVESNENLILDQLVGDPIDTKAAKSIATLTALVDKENIYTEVEKFGTIHNPENHLTIAAITLDSYIRGFYIFQHGTDFRSNEESSKYIHALSSLVTVYLMGRFAPMHFAPLIGVDIPTGSPSNLSPRQLLILAGMVEGKTNHELALELGFSVSTIRHETMAIYRSLGVSDRKEAAKVAQKDNL